MQEVQALSWPLPPLKAFDSKSPSSSPTLQDTPSRPRVGSAIVQAKTRRVATTLTGGRVPGNLILTTQAMAKEFRGIVAVDSVDLKVERGTIHALIGPHEAGKTTCCNLLTKFLSPTRGRISFNGRDITRAGAGR